MKSSNLHAPGSGKIPYLKSFGEEHLFVPVVPDLGFGGTHQAPRPARTSGKRFRNLKLGAVLMVGCGCLVLSAFAQYAIDWSTIDDGGGTSTGGVYSVSGTIGQHDAGGPMTGGNYSLTGGYWSLFAVQTPGAPLLSIMLTTTNTAMVYWPSPSSGFSLQQSPNLATPAWTTPAESVTDNGTIKFIIVNPPVTSRFYRLKNP